MKRRILIVEDQTVISLGLKREIIKLGHEVVATATNYDDAIYSIEQKKPDIIIMDIHLGNDCKDGIDIADTIRLEGNQTPILYITAYSDEITLSRAAQTNPVGYMTKPYKNDDLKSTLILTIYKIEQANKEMIEKIRKPLGYDYYYDPENENLFYKDIPIQLSVKESTLLKMLFEAKEMIVPFSKLEYIIWPDGPVSNSTLRTLNYRLRAKLDNKLIETIPSFGIKLTIHK
ncbi:response regulator [Poseidonibacter lekithochrous]|uniref:response regulator n=1 Tax=Poseidonibacter lekithochrous TaxID=1904463 RepID=UPI0008FC5963|nr:response regulator [Poseidonibacter lekithochrous]QKJ23289.1 two-component system response regulator [Poseidonibacter lekithochrous]